MEDSAKPIYAATCDAMAPLTCDWPKKQIGVAVSAVMRHAQYPETGAMSISVELPSLSTSACGRFTAPGKWQEKAAEDIAFVLDKIRAIQSELSRHEDRLCRELAALQPAEGTDNASHP